MDSNSKMGGIMKILYVRVSSLEQRTDRQRVNENEFDLIVEDKCSGSIPLFDREGGKKILCLLDKGIHLSLHVYSIDRMGRDLKDLINTIHFFKERGVCIHFISQGLRTMDEDGKENPISKMIISILGVVSEMDRSRILENQRIGIELGKLRGVYTGRKTGSSEDKLKFLEKHKKVVDLIRKGYKGSEISSITGKHPNTITKVKKVLDV
jgi:DNA invertase Pin-like site-specific DNA recombinase